METRERPILFSAPMVRAILASEKTVTRRVVKPQPPHGCTYAINGAQSAAVCASVSQTGEPMFVPPTGRSKNHLLPCPYGAPGDRLWVRETWRAEELRGGVNEGLDGIRFAADNGFVPIENTLEASVRWGHAQSGKAWRPSIHIPRWASRITLEVVSVRVERLCSLDDSEAIREGIPAAGDVRPFARFAELWDAINGDRAPWASDPWVWRVEFKRAEVTL